MSEDPTATTAPEAPADETFESAGEPVAGAAPTGAGREWIVQLQSMIENLAEQAAPVIREVGAKAAELAALAGDKAGPVAQRAAEITSEAGHKLASRSRDFAAELRRDNASHEAADADATDETIAGDAP